MVNLDKLREKYKKDTEKSSNFYDDFFQLKTGEEATVRFLPWERDEQDFFSETSIHRVETTTGNKNMHCPKIKGKDCPLCDTYFAIWNKINKIGKETEDGKRLAGIARSCKANPRYYFNVVDRRTGEVKILSAGFKLYTKIIGTFLDEDYGDLTDWKAGWDFKIVRDQGPGGFPNYDRSAPRPKPCAAGTKEEIAVWKEEVHDIHGMIKVADYDDLNLVAKGVESIVFDGPAGVEDVPANENEKSVSFLSHLDNLDDVE